MFKKIFGLFLGLVLTVNVSFVANASEDAPTDWAVKEVEAAIVRNMVPTELTTAYQTDIKRYEYVLLAVELLELQNTHVNIVRQYPFSDIYDHPYEDEIVLAYNAGIVEGDGNGKFRPDDFITRQEIATLVVNLVKALEGVDELDIPVKYTYADIDDISGWALPNIHYCYNNKIMQGIGEDSMGRDIISPKGNATREQAIILVYRLSNSLGLFDDIDLGMIKLSTYDDFQVSGQEPTEIVVESTIINDFAKVFGVQFALKVLELSETDTIHVREMTENYVSLDFGNEGLISVSKTESKIDLRLDLFELSATSIVDQFNTLSKILYTSETLESSIIRGINSFETDDNYVFNEELSDKEYLSIKMNDISGEKRYSIVYQLDSN